MVRQRLPIVAIDGPVGSGKSTVARLLADRLGFLYIDTGAMYRAAAWKALREGMDLEDREAVGALMERTQIELEQAGSRVRVRCDGQDISAEIRSPEVSRATSAVADHPRVRSRLVEMQREMGRRGGVVMEGRDIGTVVFPEAQVKVYLDATAEQRARRRTEELEASGMAVSYEDTLRDLLERDRRDRTRDVGALRIAEEATVIDSSAASAEEVTDRIESLVRRLQVEERSDRI
ncbi:MAG TPA: (d)CMP kinase [bacterium]|nr:(d)CMP kinase [bacterium]HQO36028.1 (d)CMP kinase [bacterium]HQP99679.1 (d)CMP kinase [bacterium]